MEITRLLRPLSNGKWHQFDEISTQTKIDKQKVVLIANSLKDYGFLEINTEKNAVKLSDDFQKL